MPRGRDPRQGRETTVKQEISRKQFITGAAAAGLGALAPRRARAARPVTLKLGLDLASDHPTTVAATAAGKAIEAATQGNMRVQVFPNSQLGNDTNMLSELRSGAMQMMGIGDNILATLVPSAAIDNVGFVFKTSQAAWDALDGAVGDVVRADIAKTGLHPMHRIWDEGFREITSSPRQIKTPDDLHGFKIRVPPSPISVSLFRSLGAAPVTLNIDELYTALQTHVVDGQENPLGNIETQKFYQVQKYCSLTNHMWVGYWILVNGASWNALPANYQKIVADAFDEQALKQRVANATLNDSLQAKLKTQGMEFYAPDQAAFRDALAKSTFYKDWKSKFGPDSVGGAGEIHRPARLTRVSAAGIGRPVGAARPAGGPADGGCRRRPRRRRNRDPVRRRRLALRAGLAARLVWGTGRDPVPLARQPRRGDRAPPRRAYADDVLRLPAGRRGCSAILARIAALIVAAFTVAIIVPGIGFMIQQQAILTPTLQIPGSWEVAGQMAALALLLTRRPPALCRRRPGASWLVTLRHSARGRRRPVAAGAGV